MVRRVEYMVVLDGALVGRMDQHGSSISFHTPLNNFDQQSAQNLDIAVWDVVPQSMFS